MIHLYLTGILPRPEDLIETTRAYDRGKVDKDSLEWAFSKATDDVIDLQVSMNLNYVTDGMLRWQDLLRPFTENLRGLKVGPLSRWFNNNTFYRKPIVVDKIGGDGGIVLRYTYVDKLPRGYPWKAILPAPYTFSKLLEDLFYRDEVKLMFDYAKVLRSEIMSLKEAGFEYVQLSDPSLVYSMGEGISKDRLIFIKDALSDAVKGIPVKTCLQTFFGDFSRLLPDILDFPVDHLGIDLYETNIKRLEDYEFDKGISLGVVNSRNSLIEDVNELIELVKRIANSIYKPRSFDIFISPNCDLEFLPLNRAVAKIKVMKRLSDALRGELNE